MNIKNQTCKGENSFYLFWAKFGIGFLVIGWIGFILLLAGVIIGLVSLSEFQENQIVSGFFQENGNDVSSFGFFDFFTFELTHKLAFNNNELDFQSVSNSKWESFPYLFIIGAIFSVFLFLCGLIPSSIIAINADNFEKTYHQNIKKLACLAICFGMFLNVDLYLKIKKTVVHKPFLNQNEKPKNNNKEKLDEDFDTDFNNIEQPMFDNFEKDNANDSWTQTKNQDIDTGNGHIQEKCYVKDLGNGVHEERNIRVQTYNSRNPNQPIQQSFFQPIGKPIQMFDPSLNKPFNNESFNELVNQSLNQPFTTPTPPVINHQINQPVQSNNWNDNDIQNISKNLFDQCQSIFDRFSQLNQNGFTQSNSNNMNRPNQSRQFSKTETITKEFVDNNNNKNVVVSTKITVNNDSNNNNSNK